MTIGTLARRQPRSSMPLVQIEVFRQSPSIEIGLGSRQIASKAVAVSFSKSLRLRRLLLGLTALKWPSALRAKSQVSMRDGGR